MTRMKGCPSPGELERLLLENDLGRIESHLQGCPRCQDILDRIPVESAFTRVLRSRTTCKVSGRALHELIESLEKLGSIDSQSWESAGNEAADSDSFPRLDPAQEADELGWLGPYRVLEVLGAGGMGVVFRAEDRQLQRPVALKVMRPKYARRPAFRQQFLQEARAMAAVKHDHVAVIYEVGETEVEAGAEPVPFLAMELLEGMSLEAWLRDHQRPPVEWIVDLGRQVSAGLAAAHVRGLVHRDIKPANLWLERNSMDTEFRVKILDFGLAVPSDLLSPTLSKGTTELSPATKGRLPLESGEIIGTPSYMAPEQIRGEAIDARCDMFAFGCVLYQLCTGEVPFQREWKVLRRGAVMDTAPRPINDLNPAIPNALAKLIARMLAPNAEARPASAELVKKKLIELDRPKRSPRHWRLAALVGAGSLLTLLTLWWTGVFPFKPEPPFHRKLAASIPGGLSHDHWREYLQELPAEQQVMAVEQRLKELNPGFSGRADDVTIEKGCVVGLWINPNQVTDISPVSALTELRTLNCQGGKGSIARRGQFIQAEGLGGQLKSLAPLAGLKLQQLHCGLNAELADFSGLKGMRLKFLDASETQLDSLDLLAGMPLETLLFSRTRVRDLKTLRTMPGLRQVHCDGCPVDSLAPLADTRLRVLLVDFRPERGDAAFLRGIKTLQTINLQPSKTFWHRQDLPPAQP